MSIDETSSATTSLICPSNVVSTPQTSVVSTPQTSIDETSSATTSLIGPSNVVSTPQIQVDEGTICTRCGFIATSDDTKEKAFKGHANIHIKIDGLRREMSTALGAEANDNMEDVTHTRGITEEDAPSTLTHPQFGQFRRMAWGIGAVVWRIDILNEAPEARDVFVVFRTSSNRLPESFMKIDS